MITNYSNIYIYLILYLLKNDNLNLLNYNFKINKINKKNIIFFFIYYKKKIKKIIDKNIIKEKSFVDSGLYVKFWKTKLKKKSLNAFHDSTKIKNIVLPSNKFNSSDNIFLPYFISYSSLFSMFTQKNNSFVNKFFYFYIKKRKQRVSFLNYFLFKKSFLKTIYLMFNVIYMNYLPYIITENEFERSLNELNDYSYFMLNDSFYGFIFCTSAYVKLKKINSAKRLKVPLISVADLNTNLQWIDYPLLINESNKINSYYFFGLIFNIFLSSLHYKRRKYIEIYNNYKKLNYLKELIFLNEFKKKMVNKSLVYLEITMATKCFYLFLIVSFLNVALLFIIYNYRFFYEKINDKLFMADTRLFIYLLTCLNSVISYFFILYLLDCYYTYGHLFYGSDSYIFTENYIIFFDIYNFGLKNLFLLSINKFNLTFILLFSLLYPFIYIYMSIDYNNSNSTIYLYIYLIFILSYYILVIENIILFYFIYELLLILVFYSMYLTSNSRGSVEASLFFAGWAVLGSILVGLGFLILITETNSVYFMQLKKNKLTANEVYYIYILFFLGFGVKLSVWPFWYWLPKAHVEVSTGMSIFLSCILIKLSLFCLLKIQHLFLSEVSFNICIFISFFCCLDVTFRYSNLRDLKAIIAYGSVLHTNLLLALIHLDSLKSLKNSIYYIWGHSLSTTTLFIVVNMIEVRYGTRNIIYLSGLWYNSPNLVYLSIFSLLSFLDIPITLFFWGELWLWVVALNKIFFLTIQIMILVNIIFIVIFFKIWWNIFFGTPDISTKKINFNDFNYDNYIILYWLNFIQVLLGLQPNILSYISGFYI